jgi:hypothetical protein
MSRLEKDWAGMIERIRRSGAGTYGTPFFMARKDEHWKFLWAAERIVELEAEREQASQDYADLLKDYRALREQVKIGLSVYRQTGDISAIEAAL